MEFPIASFRRHLRVATGIACVWLSGCVGSPTAPEPAAGAAVEPAAAAPAPGIDARVLGAADAPVSIIEFTDIQCPYCARFALDTWPALKARYIDTGKVRFASRDLPLPFHPHAVPAAVAARCAGEQGRYFEYREALFRGQAQLADAPYEKIAAHFGLDVERFAACRADRGMRDAVRADAALAAANGIASTPTFVIGREVEGRFEGQMVSGAQPLEVFVEQIEALLEQAQR
jgi:protein-disulfide isomerase